MLHLLAKPIIQNSGQRKPLLIFYSCLRAHHPLSTSVSTAVSMNIQMSTLVLNAPTLSTLPPPTPPAPLPPPPLIHSLCHLPPPLPLDRPKNNLE